MPRKTDVKCAACHNSFAVDLDDYEIERTLYRGKDKKTKVEEYRFKCRRCGTYFITPVTVEE